MKRTTSPGRLATQLGIAKSRGLEAVLKKGGLESEAAPEMIEVFSSRCCTVLRSVAPLGPRGPSKLRVQAGVP